MRTGKIARMPAEVREELNERLRNGEMGPQLLPWLNGLPAVQEVLRTWFGGQPVNAQNLSDWRRGGFEEWLEKKDKGARVREMARYASDLARANGGSIADGASAVASGMILELLEAADGKLEAGEIGKLIMGIAAIRAEDTKKERVEIARERLGQQREQLFLERVKFQRTTCELFVKWAEDEQARSIAHGSSTNAEKIEALGQLMFGEAWSTKPGAGSSEE